MRFRDPILCIIAIPFVMAIAIIAAFLWMIAILIKIILFFYAGKKN